MNNKCFFELLNDSLNISDEDIISQTCCITNGPLDDTRITLKCNHSFNYIPLYQEIIKQKNCRVRNKYLMKNCIECPYCRNIQTTILPYKKLPGVQRIKGVNSPKQWSMLVNKCLVCNIQCSEQFCSIIHDKMYNRCHCIIKKKNNKTEVRCHNKGNYMIEGDNIKLCGIHHNQYQKHGISKLNLFKKND
tara:strand:+ start:32315 stop:32884 length:570 start_codon:yes stop_codon:yes gene_type:complete